MDKFGIVNLEGLGIKAEVEMIVYISKDISGNQEIEDIEDITDIEEFEIKDIIC